MRHYTVAIVGAGVAGCTAARTLIQNGVDDIVVLEGSEQIGGRVRTITFGEGNKKLELGAQWIHGDIDNPLYEELNAKGLVEFKGEYLIWNEHVTDTRYCYDFDGTRIDKGVLLKGFKVSELLDELLDDFWDPHTDIEEFKRQHFTSICVKLKLTDTERKACQKVLVWLDKSNKPSEGTEIWDRSQRYFDEDYYDDCGNKDIIFTEGAYSIFEHLLLPTMGDKIKLGAEVNGIDWSNKDAAVKLHMSGGEVYTADHVIVTPSVGYLKHNHKMIFSPSLPLDKTEALDKLWMGTVEKYVFCYDEPFWTKEARETADFSGFAFLMDESDELKLTPTMAEILGPEALWWREVANMETVSANPNALIVWLSNGSAKEARHCTDTQVTAAILTLLKHYTGITAPEPSKFIRTNWGTDRHFLGSYSSDVTPQYSSALPKIMMEPIYCNNSPVILFAGEAYHHKWMSTLHGAYDTGKQQANIICQYLTSKLN